MLRILAVDALAACLIVASGASAPAKAFGAIALGVAEDGIKSSGFALGTSWGYPTQNQASQRALTECRTYDANPKAAKQCKILDTFHDQCYAMAMDPETGKSAGFGLAIANKISAAEERALADCKKSAGDRADFCEVSDSNCDE
jgi:Domain of unknown function (DUF4189)